MHDSSATLILTDVNIMTKVRLEGGHQVERLHPNVKDLTGQTFGRLTVSQPTAIRVNRNVVWSCRCKCGNQYLVKGTDLLQGRVVSCGCYHSEMVAQFNKDTKTTHGHSRVNSKASPTYNTWHMMKQRCTNPKATDYKYYGGKGIEVCSRWQEFHNFLSDMGIRPEGYTLSRKDHEGNYEPGNCSWERAGTH